MNLEIAAQCLEALASSHRLGIYRLMVQSGQQGLPVGEIQQALGLPASTLSHHLSRLVNQGLIRQRREGRSLICCCNYEMMENVVTFLTENCCCGQQGCEPASDARSEGRRAS